MAIIPAFFLQNIGRRIFLETQCKTHMLSPAEIIFHAYIQAGYIPHPFLPFLL